MLNTFESRPTTPMPTPSERPAVSSGRSVASSEPNTMNRTTAAARNPNSRPLESPPWLADCATCPPTSNWTASVDADVILSTNSLASLVETLLDWASNVTLANATSPLGEICALPAGSYGDATDETCGSLATCANSASALARVAGSVTLPWRAPITSWSVSPEAFGALRCSSRIASKLCVCGSLKLSEYELPTAPWISVTPTIATIQPRTTRRLWTKQVLASVRIRA